MTFKQHLLGNIDPALFAATIFFAAFGILFVLMMGTRLRNPQSLNSPNEFSWKYLRTDNFKRIVASSIAVLATLRFMPDLTGWELSPWKGFVVGAAWDSIALIVKQKTELLDPKPKNNA